MDISDTADSSKGKYDSSDQDKEEHSSERENRKVCSRLPPVRGLITLVCCVLFELTSGVTYVATNMLPYLTSYLRNMTGDTSLDYSETLWMFQSTFLVLSLVIWFLGIVEQRIPNRLFIGIGWLCFTTSFIASYWVVQKSFIATVCVYGILQGLGQSMVFPSAIKLALRWFPKRKGLVSGITMAGYGGGAFIWNQIITMWINPNNLQPDLEDGENLYFTQPEVLNRVPSCYLLLGGVLGGIQLVCLLLISYPPSASDINESNDVKPDHDTTSTDVTTDVNKAEKENGASVTVNSANKILADTDGGDRTVENDFELVNVSSGVDNKGFVNDYDNGVLRSASIIIDDANDDGVNDNISDQELANRVTLLQILKSRITWILYLQNVLLDLGFLMVILFYKAYAQTFVHNDHLLSMAASTASLFNAAGRPLWGLLADRIGLLNALMISMSMLSCLVSTFMLCEFGGAGMFFTWICLMYLAVSGPFSLNNPIFYSLFGDKNYIFVMGIIYSEGVISVPMMIYGSSALKQNFGWHGVFLFGSISVFFCAAVVGTVVLNLGHPLDPRMQRALGPRRQQNQKTTSEKEGEKQSA